MTGAEGPLLSLIGVSKFFGALAAVRDLSLDVRQGEVLGIGGPNGAGKTTLFEVISGLNPATAGEVRLVGRDITRLSAEAICHAGIARTFQLNACFDTLTVRENVLAAAYFGRDNRLLPGLRLDRDSQARADEALAMVGLADKRQAMAGQLAVLDRKLLMLAGAVVTKPVLLLMDEPVGGLNARETDRIMAIVRDLAGAGMTIMLIEHVMRFLVELSDRVAILHHGELIFDGKPQALFEDTRVIDVYLGAGAAGRLKSELAQSQAGRP